jgi:hypothetical protein
MLLLRRDTNDIIDNDKIKNYKSDKLFEEIEKYITNYSNKTNIENIKLYFPNNGNDFIVTRKDGKITIYNRKVNFKHFVSFNTIIQKQETNNLDDFDLFRIKLGIIANYDYVSSNTGYNGNSTTRPLKS